ncbi:hypothetical protein Tco_0759946 [Tanacetum coccineum]
MSSNSDDIQAAGSDTRPPMLDRTDYESWSQRIRLYCRGKENGLQILQSIDQGPFELGTTRDALGTTPEGGVLLGPERPRTYEDLSDTEKKRYDADVRATNIVLQGLPKDIYKLINHNIEAKAIWDNVKMLLAGSELTKEDRESQLYDEFERFKMLPGENINEYYVRFHKLVNDMRNIRMTMPNIQLNSKFVNNMSPEWDRFVTAVKLNKGLKETNHEQLYAYLKQHEKHAAQDRLIIERITPATNDQLAFVSTIYILRIFGVLCYPTNNSEDLGKLKAKADIGFFVGYAPNRKGYRIYNKRTRQIMETIHVTFDELTEQTAPVHSSSGPNPNLLTPGLISSGLVPNSAPAIPYVPPTNKDLELLFQPMFDEYFETPTGDHQMPHVPAVPPPVIPTGPSVSISFDHDAPSGSHSL